MSHYAVAVFSDNADFDSLLEPYNEQDKRYMEFKKVDIEVIEADFKEFLQLNPTYTFDEYIDVQGYHQENGEWGYSYNPQGYWDYYTLDGKSYLYEEKDEALGQSMLRKNDIEWNEEDEVIAETSGFFWDRYIATTKNGEPPSLYKREYFLERYKTREQYVAEQSVTVPYAFITPDGVWHAPGRVGWFGVSDESAEDWNKYKEEWNNYLAKPDNPFVSIVDCHI